MKIVLYATLISVFAFYACDSDKKEDGKDKKTDTVVVKDTVKEVHKEVIISEDGEIPETKDWNEFEKIYSYEENETIQKMGVNWITNDSIEFRILYEKGGCKQEIISNAVNLFPDMDPEMDEDEDGGYPAIEYSLEGENWALGIRIEMGDQTKARVIMTPIEEVDCMIDEMIIMRLQ